MSLIEAPKKGKENRKVVITPSMRRPVGVKWAVWFFQWTRVFLPPSNTVAILPSAVVVSARLAASWAFSFQPVLLPVRRPLLHLERWRLGQALYAVTGTRHQFSLHGRSSARLRSHRNRGLLVVHGFVSFSTHPEMMQQHRKLSCGGDDGAFLPIPSAASCQLQSPSS